MSKESFSNHNSGIDVLRGISILTVILLHINIRVPFSDTWLGSTMPNSLYKILFWSGYYGVCIFFVISGFLITTSAINKWNTLPDLSLQGFYTMRFARIMPLLIGLLLVLSVLHLAGIKGFVINPKQTSLGRAIFAALTFHINWLEIKTGYLPGSWDALWSLSIEEVFYFFFPLVCIFIRKEKYFIYVALLFLIISPFARTSWFLNYGFDEPDRNHFAYLDAISIGCLTAIIAARAEIRKSSLTGISFIGWGLVILIMIFRGVVHDLGLGKSGLNVTVLAIGTAMVLIWMQKRFVSGKQMPSKLTGALRFLGRNSYEIYLTHMFVVYLFVETYKTLKFTGEWAWVLYLTVIIISGMLGYMVAKYFSNPANLYLRKLFAANKLKRIGLYNFNNLNCKSGKNEQKKIF